MLKRTMGFLLSVCVLFSSCLLLSVNVSAADGEFKTKPMIKIGGYYGDNISQYPLEFTVVLRSDGTVWTCGFNYYGQLGNGGWDSSSNRTNTKLTKISGLDHIVYIEVGNASCIALKNDGTLWAWGNSYYGNLGTDSNSRTNGTPEQVLDSSGNVFNIGDYLDSVYDVNSDMSVDVIDAVAVLREVADLN